MICRGFDYRKAVSPQVPGLRLTILLRNKAMLRWLGYESAAERRSEKSFEFSIRGDAEKKRRKSSNGSSSGSERRKFSGDNRAPAAKLRTSLKIDGKNKKTSSPKTQQKHGVNWGEARSTLANFGGNTI